MRPSAVRVLDRDSSLADTGGHRLHVDPTARATRGPAPALYRAIWAGSARPAAFRRFALLDDPHTGSDVRTPG